MHDRIEVVEWLAHSHEDEVAQPAVGVALPESAANVKDLCDDFAGSEVANEAHLARGAEYAAHGTAGLGADAGGEASVVAHEDGFDGLAVVEF